VTIPSALHSAAERGIGEFTFYLEEGPAQFGTADLVERGERQAQRLLSLGIEPGDAVGVLGPNRPEWVVSAFAAWLSGAILVPIQIPLRVRDPDAFREQLRNLAEAAGCRLVLCDPAMLGLLPEDTGIAWDDPARGGSAELPEVEPGDSAVIQFSSGSTAMPKGARLTHRAVMAQMEILREGIHRDGEPRSILSWTPFFHDLGLFYNIVQVVTWGLASHHLPTERFARDPIEWLRLIERTRVDNTVAPSSAFGSAVKAAKLAGERPDLSTLEAAYFAAEGVDPAVIRSMVEMAEDLGFREEALGSTYGLAEAVMAVSYPPVGSGMRMERISLADLTGSGVATLVESGSSRTVVSCGPPRMEVRVTGPAGSLEERSVGEIEVRGTSLMSGYVGDAAVDPFDEDGWLHTGDLGYMADGELYVTGRAKDMMIAMGHNYYPEDFEWAAARADGVKPGRCVAFSLPGGEGEEIAVLVEARDSAVSEGFEGEVADTIADTIGVRPRRVIVLSPGTVEKTTSGKLRRTAMREAYAGGTLAKMPRP
jgi:fatty-acyl-CoA synthase